MSGTVSLMCVGGPAAGSMIDLAAEANKLLVPLAPDHAKPSGGEPDGMPRALIIEYQRDRFWLSQYISIEFLRPTNQTAEQSLRMLMSAYAAMNKRAPIPQQAVPT